MSLTEEQQQKIGLFCELTACPPSQAAQILSNHAWDVNESVNFYFLMNSGDHSLQQHQPSTSTPSNPHSHSIPAPIEPRYTVEAAPVAQDAPQPQSWMDYAMSFVPQSVWSILSEEQNPRAYFDDFERNYGSAHPRFFQGTYAQALGEARRCNRPLFVYLHSPMHDDSEAFCRDTLCNPDLSHYLDQHFLSWFGDVRSADATSQCVLLSCDSFPFIALLMNGTHSSSSLPVATVLGRHTGLIAPEQLLQKLDERRQAFVQLTTTRHVQEAQRSESVSLREEQDAEYEQALAQDRLRQEEEERLAREKQQREEEERKRIEEETRQREEIEQARLQSLQRVPEEPEESADGVVKLQLRLPDGTRLRRRFLEEHTIEQLCWFVESHELAVDGEPVTEYEVVSNYPKKVYADRSLTFREAGLTRGASLFVQQIL